MSYMSWISIQMSKRIKNVAKIETILHRGIQHQTRCPSNLRLFPGHYTDRTNQLHILIHLDAKTLSLLLNLPIPITPNRER